MSVEYVQPPLWSFGETLFDRCRRMDPAVLQNVVRLAEGAAYLIQPSIVQGNVAAFRGALQQAYPAARVSFSYKTNYISALIAAARAAGALSEVVSPTECAYARGLGVSDDEIIFNGPGKTEAVLRSVLERPITLIADSVLELERIAALVRDGMELRARLGIRLSPKLSFQRTPSRFGIDLDRGEDVRTLQRLVLEDGLPIVGMHLHLTDDRSVDAFLERVDFLVSGWARLQLGRLAFIDCGGGFASAMPEEVRTQLGYQVASLETYGTVIGRHLRDLFPDGEVEFYCEPGTGILADAGVFVTPVEDVKTVGGRSIAVVDGTMFCVNPLRSATRPACFRVPVGAAGHKVPAPVAVYGNSCMEIDLLAGDFDAPLAPGDLLVFAQKGAYASCMASPFIQGIPAVVSIDDSGSLALLRARTGDDLLAALN